MSAPNDHNNLPAINAADNLVAEAREFPANTNNIAQPSRSVSNIVCFMRDSSNAISLFRPNSNPNNTRISLEDKNTIEILKLQEKVITFDMPASSSSDNQECNARTRKIVAQWVRDVCETKLTDISVPQVAMCYLDRFLAQAPGTPKSKLQGVASACLMIASKIRDSKYFSAKWLSAMSDSSVSAEDIFELELMVLRCLNWDLETVVATDYTPFLLARLRPLLKSYVRFIWGNKMQDEIDNILNTIKVRVDVMIQDCFVQEKFNMVKPSLLNAICIVATVLGMFGSNNIKVDRRNRFYRRMSNRIETILDVDMCKVNSYVNFINSHEVIKNIPKLHP